jgi:hypothetical protein
MALKGFACFGRRSLEIGLTMREGTDCVEVFSRSRDYRAECGWWRVVSAQRQPYFPPEERHPNLNADGEDAKGLDACLARSASVGLVSKQWPSIKFTVCTSPTHVVSESSNLTEKPSTAVLTWCMITAEQLPRSSRLAFLPFFGVASVAVAKARANFS